jgi:predicted O-methyltransferase YrrM
MFHDIPEAVAARMAELKERGVRDRADGTPRMQRLREVPEGVGRFLAILAAGAPDGRWVEIGTSAGYSTLWLALAARETGRRVTTFEILEWKVELARETFAVAGVEDVVELVHADVRAGLQDVEGVSFAFLDSEKEDYLELYELVVPKLVPGGLLVADNVADFHDEVQPMLDRAEADERVDVVVVPFLTGQLLARRRT